MSLARSSGNRRVSPASSSSGNTLSWGLPIAPATTNRWVISGWTGVARRVNRLVGSHPEKIPDLIEQLCKDVHIDPFSVGAVAASMCEGVRYRFDRVLITARPAVAPYELFQPSFACRAIARSQLCRPEFRRRICAQCLPATGCSRAMPDGSAHIRRAFQNRDNSAA